MEKINNEDCGISLNEKVDITASNMEVGHQVWNEKDQHQLREPITEIAHKVTGAINTEKEPLMENAEAMGTDPNVTRPTMDENISGPGVVRGDSSH